MDFKRWFNENVLGRKPEPQVQDVVPRERVLSPDELAEKLAQEANDLFDSAHAKRQEAAQTLESAAESAKAQAEALVQRAEALRQVAAQRVERALKNRTVADKLAEFLD
jgi:hypothetical protein